MSANPNDQPAFPCGVDVTQNAEVKTSEVLFGAIEVLREHGWCQFMSRNKAGACCLYAAIDASARCNLSMYYKASEALKVAVNTPVSIFNDVHCESIDDACAALEIAACCSAAEGD